MNTLIRILQLWRINARMDFVWITSDPKLFLMYFGSDTIVNIAGVTTTLLLAERFAGIGDWSKWQVVFMLGYGTLALGILETFFSFNISHISRRLGRGQFDHTLIQPQPIWMALLTDGFIPFSGSGSLIAGFVLLVWSAQELALNASFVWLGALSMNVVASAAIMLSFSFLVGSLAFWAPRAAEEISTPTMYLFAQLRPFPLDGVGTLLRGSLLVIFPVGFVAWVPCRYLLGLEQATIAALITPLAALVIASLAVVVFQKGMRHYGRVGSQRYDALGHRA